MGDRMSEPNTRRRLVVIGLIVVALFAGLLTRLWFLQVAGGEDLAVAAQRNGDKIVQIPAIRGRILDAKGRVLAETVPVTSLVVDRQQLTDATRPKLVANLATLLRDTPENINKEIDNQNYPGFQPIPIIKGVSDEIATAWSSTRATIPRRRSRAATCACTRPTSRPTWSATSVASTRRSTRRGRSTATPTTTSSARTAPRSCSSRSCGARPSSSGCR